MGSMLTEMLKKREDGKHVDRNVEEKGRWEAC